MADEEKTVVGQDDSQDTDDPTKKNPTDGSDGNPVENDKKGEDNTDPDKKPEHKENRVQKRIDKLTREKYYWKGIAEGLQRGSGQHEADEQPDQLKRPVRSDFGTDGEYMEAITTYNENLVEMANNAPAKVDTSKISATFKAREKTARESIPDYDEVIDEASDTPVNNATAEAILTSEVGPEIRYELAKDHDLADRLFSMSPIACAREIGKIEARILDAKEKKPKSKVSKAAPPISPVETETGSRSGDTKSAADIYKEITKGR